MTTADDVLKLIKANDVKFADFRFTDPRGKWQHVTFDIGMIEEETFSEGMMFDGSSIAGWKTVHDSDVAAIGAPHGRERAARRHSTLGAQAAPLRYPRIGVSPGDVKAGKPIANGAALDARAQPFVRAPPAICVETTNSRHNWCVIPNLTSGVVLTGLDQLWAGDITDMHVTEAFGDLAVILDAFSRKVVGWALEAHLLAISALVMAIISRQPIPGALIHHFIRIAASNIPAPNTRKSSLRTTSSRRVGDSYDNAKVELHEKLEHEEINGNSYRNLRKPEAPSEPLSNPCITASDCIRP